MSRSLSSSHVPQHPAPQPALRPEPQNTVPADLYVPMSAHARVVNLLAVVIPFLGLIIAIVWCWTYGLNGVHLAVFGVMSILTGLGITVGYHRLFTHRSFDCHPAVKFTLALLGSMAVEGPILKWVAQHRRHHQHSDEPGDPHSPHLHGEGAWEMLKGLWHSHVGWVLTRDSTELDKYIGDLRRDRMVRAMSRLFPLWVIVSLVLPAAIGGLITMSWGGVWMGFVWGGLTRIFIVHHVTWSINSVCHIWGSRPFKSDDESRNNAVCGVLGFGEGWHNNHHAFPNSARHGLEWWQLDVSYLVIRLLALLGLAWNLKLPAQEMVERKRQA